MCPGRMQSRLTAANLEPSCGLREARGLVERSQSLACQCWSQTPPRRPSHISEVTNSDCWQVLFSLGQQKPSAWALGFYASKADFSGEGVPR